MVVPTFSALLSNTTIKLGSNASPLLSTFSLNKQQHHSVFLFSPGPFNQAWIQDFLPAM
jgi:hypothetical protein